MGIRATNKAGQNRRLRKSWDQSLGSAVQEMANKADSTDEAVKNIEQHLNRTVPIKKKDGDKKGWDIGRGDIADIRRTDPNPKKSAFFVTDVLQSIKEDQGDNVKFGGLRQKDSWQPQMFAQQGFGMTDPNHPNAPHIGVQQQALDPAFNVRDMGYGDHSFYNLALAPVGQYGLGIGGYQPIMQ